MILIMGKCDSGLGCFCFLGLKRFFCSPAFHWKKAEIIYRVLFVCFNIALYQDRQQDWDFNGGFYSSGDT